MNKKLFLMIFGNFLNEFNLALRIFYEIEKYSKRNTFEYYIYSNLFWIFFNSILYQILFKLIYVWIMLLTVS